MSSSQKIVGIILIASTVASIAIISQTMYLYFGAYRVTNFLSFSINSVEYHNSTVSGCIDVEIVLYVENPTEFALKIDFIDFTLELNGNFLGKAYARMFYPTKPIDLQPFKSDNATLKLDRVPMDQVVGQSPKTWLMELSQVHVIDVPYLGGMRLLNIPVPPFYGD
jgi:hypothetical protein